MKEWLKNHPSMASSSTLMKVYPGCRDDKIELHHLMLTDSYQADLQVLNSYDEPFSFEFSNNLCYELSITPRKGFVEPGESNFVSVCLRKQWLDNLNLWNMDKCLSRVGSVQLHLSHTDGRGDIETQEFTIALAPQALKTFKASKSIFGLDFLEKYHFSEVSESLKNTRFFQYPKVGISVLVACSLLYCDLCIS